MDPSSAVSDDRCETKIEETRLAVRFSSYAGFAITELRAESFDFEGLIDSLTECFFGYGRGYF